MFHSRKDKDSKNLNRIIYQDGVHQYNKDILDFVVYDGGNEYTIGQLLDKIVSLEAANKRLRRALKRHEAANNANFNLLTKSVQLLSAKMAAAEDEITTLKTKTKYL